MVHSSGKVWYLCFFVTCSFRPGFRESAFQPFKREDENGEDKEDTDKKQEELSVNEVEDSEGDEMVDIERIEDKEEDSGPVSEKKKVENK